MIPRSDPREGRRTPGFQQSAEVVGYICVEFANIEGIIDHFLSDVLGLQATTDLSAAVMAHIGLRVKCNMLLSAGFVMKPNDLWLEDLEQVVRLIDNEITNTRNRLVHEGHPAVLTWIGEPTIRSSRSLYSICGSTLALCWTDASDFRCPRCPLGGVQQ